MSQILPTYLVDQHGVPIDNTNPLPTSGGGGGGGTVDQGKSNADPAKGWSTQLTDGSGFITPAKTGQLPTALGATTAAGSLSVGIATDQLSTLATATKQDTGNSSLATIATTQTDGSQKTQVTSSALPTGAATAAKQPAIGTAGTPSSDVLSVQGIAHMTPVQVSQATASNLNAQVVGAAANGAAAAGNPVLMAGIDTTTARTLRTDASGNLSVVGSGTTGAAVTTRPVQVGGSDGTNLRDLATDTSGRLKAAGIASFQYITAAGTYALKTSAGVLRKVQITASFSAGSFTIYNDNNATTTPIAGFGTDTALSWDFNLVCSNGVTAVAGAGFDGQITVEWD